MTRVYISGALRGSCDLDSACRFYELVAANLETLGASTYLPHLKTHPVKQSQLSAGEVFKQDVGEIRGSNLLLAFANEPSLGVGSEVALALEFGLLVVLAFEAGSSPSRFLVGQVEESALGHVIEYQDTEDLTRKFGRFLGANNVTECSIPLGERDEVSSGAPKPLKVAGHR